MYPNVCRCLSTTFLFSLSFMNFYAPRVINPYPANKIVEWAHAKTKITQM